MTVHAIAGHYFTVIDRFYLGPGIDGMAGAAVVGGGRMLLIFTPGADIVMADGAGAANLPMVY